MERRQQNDRDPPPPPTGNAPGGKEHRSTAVLAALGANLAIAVAKLVAFLVTGSTAMLAEGIHSIADTSNQVLLLVGRRLSRRTATREHPFGYGQEAYFWAFLVAIVLFTLGAVFSLAEGYEKLRHPHEVESVGWAIGVLLFAMVAESVSLHRAVLEARPHRNGSWWAYIHDTRQPETAVVLLEDSAAEVGLVAALVGVVLTAVTGDARYDALGTLVIGAVLAVVAVVLAREMRSLLIGESADAGDVAALQSTLEDHPMVERLIDLRTMQLGPEDVLVAARVALHDELSVEQAAGCIDAIGEALQRAVPAATRIFIEPEVTSIP